MQTSPTTSHRQQVIDKGKWLKCWRNCSCPSAESTTSVTPKQPQHAFIALPSVFSQLTYQNSS